MKQNNLFHAASLPSLSQMPKYSKINNLHLLLLFLFCTSCYSQVNKPPQQGSLNKPQTIPDNGLGQPKTPEEIQASLDAGIDPYFVETSDTFSIYGPQCIVRNLVQDRKGNYWLATWNGIIKIDGKIFTNYTLKEGLIHFHVLSCFEDKKGNLWFGTVRGGMYRYDGNVFKLFTKQDGLVDNTVLSIAEDKEGTLWFGTENGVSRYDGKTFTNFTTKEGLNDNYVNAILQDKTGRLWFGTAKGINWYDGKSVTKFTGKDGLPFKQVASLFEDKSGNIWIGSGSTQAGGKGLCRYDGMSVSESVTPNFVMYMCEDKKGNLWLAHNEGDTNFNFSLYSYDGKSFTKITEQSKPDNPVIFGIIEDKKVISGMGRQWECVVMMEKHILFLRSRKFPGSYSIA